MTPIRYDADGRVMVDAEGTIVAWANGLPLTADGSLAVAPAADVQNFSNGLPLNEDGRVVTNG